MPCTLCSLRPKIDRHKCVTVSKTLIPIQCPCTFVVTSDIVYNSGKQQPRSTSTSHFTTPTVTAHLPSYTYSPHANAIQCTRRQPPPPSTNVNLFRSRHLRRVMACCRRETKFLCRLYGQRLTGRWTE